MANQRQLIRKLTVGDYSFDIQINRQLVLDAFKRHQKLWKIISESAKDGDTEVKIDDIDEFSKLLDKNDAMESEIPAFCEDLLPKMVALAGGDINASEFFAYCDDNGVLEEVNAKLLEFAMLGFSVGRSEKKAPKLTVKLEG